MCKEAPDYTHNFSKGTHIPMMMSFIILIVNRHNHFDQYLSERKKKDFPQFLMSKWFY